MLRVCLKLLGILGVVVGLTACSTVRSPSPADPLEGFNRAMFGFNETVDQAALRPLAKGYQTVTPPEVRTCIGNFFSNLGDIAVAFNNFLQGKPKAAGSDLCRVALNSTIGILGFVDVASELGFQKNNEDFGQTLGVWGVSSGPYLMLPFFGPSSFRDATGSLVDSPLAPVRHVNDTRTRNTLFFVQAVDKRERLLSVTDLADRVALDKYAFMRDAYLARRESLIRDGAADPTEPKDDPEEDKEDEGAWLQMDPPVVERLANADVVSRSVVLSLPGQIQASDRALQALGLSN
jgi:phospholipid-binding lipoprotein MlaA